MTCFLRVEIPPRQGYASEDRRRFLWFGRVFESVAHTTDGADELVSELFAQVSDVDVDDVGSAVEVVSPHSAQELLA